MLPSSVTCCPSDPMQICGGDDVVSSGSGTVTSGVAWVQWHESTGDGLVMVTL